MFAPPAHQPACMLLPSALAKACCTCLMLLQPSVLFLSLPLFLVCFGSVLAAVVVSAALDGGFASLPPVRQTPVNFVVLPAASCLDYTVVHCGKVISLLFFKRRQLGARLCLSADKSCLAHCFLFFFCLVFFFYFVGVSPPAVIS